MGVLVAFPEQKVLHPITDDRLGILYALHKTALILLNEIYVDLAAGAPMQATDYTLPPEKPELDFPIQPRELHHSPSKRWRPTREPKSTA